MKKKLLLFITLFAALFISTTVMSAEIEILNTNFSTYEALTQTSGSTPVVSVDGNYQVVRGTITPTGGVVAWAPTNTSFYLTNSSAGLITFNNLDLFQGGRIVIEWGSASGRPLKVAWGSVLGTDTIGTKPTLASGDRSKVMTAEFTMSADTTGIKSITIGSSGGGSVYIFSVKVYTNTSGPQAPKVKTLSIAGTAGTILQDTIRVNLPYATYTVGVTSVNTSDIVATTDSTSVTTEIKKAGVVITSFIVGDTLQYIVSKNALVDTFIVVTTATVPAPTMTNPANKSQSVKGGVAIGDIAFTTTNATGVTLTGTLPTGVTGNYAAGVYTISGIAGTEAVYPRVYNYTVTATPIGGYSGPAVSQSGTITVTDPAAKNILYITSGTYNAATDSLYQRLIKKYSVTQRASKLAAAAPFDYTGVDAIVLHESITGSEAATAGNEMALIKSVDKPILNTKSYFYTSGATPRWNLGTPDNGDSRAAITVKQPTHPIFAGITLTGDSIVMFKTKVAKNIQPTTIPSAAGNYVLGTTSHYGSVAIHEMTPAARSVVSSKYLLVSLLNTQFVDLTPSGLKLLENAVDYLLGVSTFTPVLSNEAKLKSITVTGTGTVLSPAFDPNTTTYTMNIQTTDLSTTTVKAISENSVVGTINKPATGPATITIPVTSQDGNTTVNYVITVTVGVDEAISSSKVYAVGSSIVVEGQVGQEIAVINLVGDILYKGIITNSLESLPISLEKGVYVVLVNDSSTKLIIK